MSCQLVKLATISNVTRLKSYLFPSGQDANEQDASSKAFSDAWDWPVDNTEPGAEPRSTKDIDRWPQECVVALSPTADVMALGRGNAVAFLTAKHEVAERNDWKFEVSFHSDQLSATNGDSITAMLCLPMSSQKRSYQGGPDWTCIIVGLKSGYIQMYTDDGRLLLNQLLHEEPVLSLKCQTYVPRRFSGFGEQPDEVRVTYPHAVVCIEGFGLFQTLRACRNQLARGQAGSLGSSAVTPPPLSYKKWGPQEMRRVQDCEVIGMVAPRFFDQMVTESLRKAHGGTARFSPTASSLMCATGTDPYVGFYYAKEGFVQPLLSDVAVAVASRVKNFLADSLLGKLTKTQPEEPKAPPVEPAASVPMRCGIFDKHRKGQRMFLSPSKQLAAVTDSVGRIVLFNVSHNNALRIWKGYRDAECGWVEVEDSSPETAVNGVPRRTQFLIVYAPRWGLVEVWCPHQSSRVAAFQVGKGGRLLYTNYTLMGLNNVLVKTVRPHTYPCCYLTAEGKLYAVAVPFHRVLSERSRARDWQLLNEVQVLLKGDGDAPPGGDEAQLVARLGRLLRDMKAPSVQQQALEKIVYSSKASHFVVSSVLGALEPKSQEPQPAPEGDEEMSCDYDAELLSETCRRLRQLCQLHKAVDKSQVDDIYEPSSIDISPEEVSDELSMPLKKVSRVVTNVDRYLPLWTSASSKRVTFGDENPVALPAFLGCFDVVGEGHLTRDRSFDDGPLPVTLKASADCRQLGNFLFSRALATTGHHSSLLSALKKSGITPSSLVQCLLHEWLSSTWAVGNKRAWCLFGSLLKSLVEMAGAEAHFTASLTMSPWWRGVRTVLAASPNLPAAYLGAAVVSSVARDFLQYPSPKKMEEGEEEKDGAKAEEGDKPSSQPPPVRGDRDDPVVIDDDGEVEEDSWEPVVIELDHWEALLGKLKDVLVLASLLRRPLPPSASEKRSPEAHSAETRLLPETREVSLSALFARGQGIITELVSAWACDLQMTPEDLRRLTKLTFPKGLESQEDGIDLHFVRVRRRFARSLELDSLLVNCASEQLVRWDRDRDQIDRLARASGFLAAVSSSILKNGVGLIIWKTFLQKRFEALVLLMEKMGKTPKDRICRRDVEISDIHLEPFVRFCTEVLESIVDASLGPEAESLPVLPHEPLWEDGVVPQEGHACSPLRPQSLVGHALGQRPPNLASVRHHQLLATVVHVVVLFGMRSVRPLSLFTPTVRKAFFQDLHSPLQAPVTAPSSSLRSSPQQNFLLRAASAVMQSLPDNPSSSVLGSTFGWMNRLLDLACSWGEDRDLVRRHCVCELYSAGHDILGREVSLAVKDKAQLASCLLVIAGQRVHHLLFMNDGHRPSQMALLPPHISTWLLALDPSNLRCCNSPAAQTVNLLQYLQGMLPEDHQEYRLALSLLDVLESVPTPS
ncbi:rab3 GTPase activating protein isoform X2 [Haemaphysalis longicornis]